VFVLAVGFVLAMFPKNCHEKEFVPKKINAVGTILLLVWSIVSLSGLSSFLYFNF